MLRPVKLLALLDWSDLELSLAAEDVYIRACPRPVTGPRVGYHYTALLGENGDRTFTGWSIAVTGCTFRRKV